MALSILVVMLGAVGVAGVVRAVQRRVVAVVRTLPGNPAAEDLRLRWFPLRLEVGGLSGTAVPAAAVGEYRTGPVTVRLSPESLRQLRRDPAASIAAVVIEELVVTVAGRGAAGELVVSRIEVERTGDPAAVAPSSRYRATPTPVPGSPDELLAPILAGVREVADRLPPVNLRAVGLRATAPGVTFSGSMSVDLHGGAPARVALSGEAEVSGGIVDRATLDGDVTVTVADPTRAGFEIDLRWREVRAQHPRLADGPIDFADGRYRATGRIDRRSPMPAAELPRPIPGTNPPPPPGAGAPGDEALRGVLSVTDGRLVIGAVRARFRPVLAGLSAPRGAFPVRAPARIDAELELPATPLRDIVAIVPAVVAGPLDGLALDGTLSWEMRLQAPLRGFSFTRWIETHRVDDFAIAAIPPAVDVRRLAGPFRHRIVDEVNDYQRVVLIPPSQAAGGRSGGGTGGPSALGSALGDTPEDAPPDPDYRFVPLAEIAPALLGAVVTVEDGEFYRHQGVNWLSLLRAVERNLRERDIVIGGSTIPMQLAKNVFLDNRRIVARKVQELGLVALGNLAGAVSRDRLLEVYLNVIEFGPGVWGIADAADHYFNTTPDRLSVPQAVWLASIIQSPRRLSSHAVRGRVPEAWLAWMARIMDIMVERERLSPDERAAARGRQPRFAPD